MAIIHHEVLAEDIEIRFQVPTQLIGLFIVLTGPQIYDTSVAKRLRMLEAQTEVISMCTHEFKLVPIKKSLIYFSHIYGL